MTILTIDGFKEESSDVLIGLVDGAIEFFGGNPVEAPDFGLKLEVFVLVSRHHRTKEKRKTCIMMCFAKIFSTDFLRSYFRQLYEFMLLRLFPCCIFFSCF